MLTFDKLVQLAADKLANTNGPNGQPITLAIVHDVLQDAGIDECLRHLTGVPQGRLVIHAVNIAGTKNAEDQGGERSFQYQRTLGTGLWAWVGQNGSGKSTILNCIIWALTGADSGIPKRIRAWINEVLVHFSIGDQRFTSRVSRTADGNTSGGVYPDFLTLTQIDLEGKPLIQYASRDEMREALDLFFMQQLGISTVRWTAHSAQKDDPDLHAHSTTWRTYAHAIQIEDDSYDDLIIDPQKGYGRQDRKILEMMLGVEPARAVAEIQVQADFAKEGYGRARSRVSGKRDSLQAEIQRLGQECLDIQQAIELMQNTQTPVEDDSVFVHKRERRAVLLAEQNQFDQEIATLDAQKSQLERDILEAERARIALQEQSEVEYLINSLVVARCPHCELPVNESSRLEDEKQQHVCHVCSQPLQKTRSRGDIRVLLKERDAETATLRTALKRAQQDITERLNKLATSREESSRLGRELQTNVHQARQGFTESYATLLVRKGQAEGQLEQMKRSLAEIDDEHHEVETAAMWHIILQTAAEIADAYVFDLYNTVFAELSKLVVHLGQQFGLPDLEQVIIDEKRFVKLVQGGMVLSHNDLARSERVKFKVAFHLALMLLQVRSGLGKHPGFLIIDTPGTAEVNDADFVAMNRDLANLHEEYGDQVQILLATARTEALEHLPSAVVQQPTRGGRFF